MTGASAFARGFAQLTAARIGVGIGEASANPAAYSLLSDYFPPARRATVLAIYPSGIYIGAGLGLFIGGLIVNRWDAAFAAGSAPLGLRGWQVAFLAVGLPGLLLALWVSTLREPRRGKARAASRVLRRRGPGRPSRMSCAPCCRRSRCCIWAWSAARGRWCAIRRGGRDRARRRRPDRDTGHAGAVGRARRRRVRGGLLEPGTGAARSRGLCE